MPHLCHKVSQLIINWFPLFEPRANLSFSLLLRTHQKRLFAPTYCVSTGSRFYLPLLQKMMGLPCFYTWILIQVDFQFVPGKDCDVLPRIRTISRVWLHHPCFSAEKLKSWQCNLLNLKLEDACNQM